MIQITETNHEKIEALINFMSEINIDYQTNKEKVAERNYDPLEAKYPIWYTSDIYKRRLAFARFYFNGKKDAEYWNVVRHCGSHIKAEKLYLEAEQNNRKELIRHLEDVLNKN